jgi:hypothetical protein
VLRCPRENACKHLGDKIEKENKRNLDADAPKQRHHGLTSM